MLRFKCRIQLRFVYSVVYSPKKDRTILVRAVGKGGGGKGAICDLPPPDFGRYVNPISIRRVDYATPLLVTTSLPPRFSDLPMAQLVTFILRA